MAVVRVRPLFKGIGIKNGPGILLHIFTAVCIHCLRIIFQSILTHIDGTRIEHISHLLI